MLLLPVGIFPFVVIYCLEIVIRRVLDKFVAKMRQRVPFFLFHVLGEYDSVVANGAVAD